MCYIVSSIEDKKSIVAKLGGMCIGFLIIFVIVLIISSVILGKSIEINKEWQFVDSCKVINSTIIEENTVICYSGNCYYSISFRAKLQLNYDNILGYYDLLRRPYRVLAENDAFDYNNKIIQCYYSKYNNNIVKTVIPEIDVVALVFTIISSIALAASFIGIIVLLIYAKMLSRQ